MPDALLKVRNLKKYFPIRGGLLSREVARVHAVDDVSFDIMPGEQRARVREPAFFQTDLKDHRKFESFGGVQGH